MGGLAPNLLLGSSKMVKDEAFWLVVSNMFFPFHMGCHLAHWRTHMFQDGYCTTNQTWYFDVFWFFTCFHRVKSRLQTLRFETWWRWHDTHPLEVSIVMGLHQQLVGYDGKSYEHGWLRGTTHLWKPPFQFPLLCFTKFACRTFLYRINDHSLLLLFKASCYFMFHTSKQGLFTSS